MSGRVGLMSCRFPTLPDVVMRRKYPFLLCVDVEVGSTLETLCRRSLLWTHLFSIELVFLSITFLHGHIQRREAPQDARPGAAAPRAPLVIRHSMQWCVKMGGINYESCNNALKWHVLKWPGGKEDWKSQMCWSIKSSLQKRNKVTRSHKQIQLPAV